MINLSQTRIVQSRTFKLVPNTRFLGEGFALVGSYVNGELHVMPSTGADGERFVGMSINQITYDPYRPQIENLVVDADGNILLSRDALLTALTAVKEGTTDKVTLTPDADDSRKFGTGLSDGDVVTASYLYSPSIAELISTQGSTEPGVGMVGITGATGVILKGEVYTNNFDPTADWTDPKADVYAGADGRFTTEKKGAKVNCLILHTPAAGKAELGIEIL